MPFMADCATCENPQYTVRHLIFTAQSVHGVCAVLHGSTAMDMWVCKGDVIDRILFEHTHKDSSVM